MKQWSVIVLIEPDQKIEEVVVTAHSATDAKPKAIVQLLNDKYRNKGCRFTVAQVDEIPD